MDQRDLTGRQSIPETSSAQKASKGQKSFSHELGPRGGIKLDNLRARSYSDLTVFCFFFLLDEYMDFKIKDG